jgi:integrase
MIDEIKVHVVKYPDRDNYVMRYVDPITRKQVQRSTGTKVKRDADKAAGKWEAELREGRYRAQSRMTWEEFRQKYEDEVLPALAESTGGCKNAALNHVEETINPIYLREMTTQRMSAFAKLLRDGGMIETTLAATLAHLKPVLKWAVQQGYLRAVPEINMPARINEGSQSMRSRAITGEELDRMIAKVADKRKHEPEKWKRLLRGLYLSGMRLSEALALSWDDGAPISVSMAGKYPALLIQSGAQKNHKEQLLPLAPEFAEFLLAVPKANRVGLVFGIYGKSGRPLSTKRASRYISAIGEAAKVVTNKADGKYASAHDLRRAFCTRWAKRIMPADLKVLARHSSINTTMRFYVTQSADDVASRLRAAIGTNSGTNEENTRGTTDVEADANADRINA